MKWEDYSERDRVMMVRETRQHLKATVSQLTQSPLSAVGLLIEEQNPELASIFKEAGEFGDRIALRLKELEEK